MTPTAKIPSSTHLPKKNTHAGPPFSIPLAEVQRLYCGQLGYKVEMLRSVDARKDYQVRTIQSSVYLVRFVRQESGPR